MYGRGETTYTNKDLVERLVRQAEISGYYKEIEDWERKLAAIKAKLAGIQRECHHKWSDPIDTAIVTEGYTDPGDAPGTMGIDFRGPCYIPGTREQQWTRVCSVCGKTEATSQVTQKVSTSPKF